MILYFIFALTNALTNEVMARTRTVSRLVKRFLFEISTSRSPLESWDLFSKFLFLFSKLEKIADFSIIFCKNSRSLLEPENRSRHFSFLFSKFEIWIPYFSFSSRFHFLASRQCLNITSTASYDTINYQSLMQPFSFKLTTYTQQWQVVHKITMFGIIHLSRVCQAAMNSAFQNHH